LTTNVINDLTSSDHESIKRREDSLSIAETSAENRTRQTMQIRPCEAEYIYIRITTKQSAKEYLVEEGRLRRE